MLWGMDGAREGYDRTRKLMNDIEMELGLGECTKSPINHKIPYFLMMGIEIVFSIGMTIYYF